MDDLKQQWAVTLEEKHDPITVIGGQRGSGKIFFLENMVKFLKEQLKQEKIETERWKSAALYYADKLGSAQNEKGYADGKADAMADLVRCKDCKHWHEETGWCDQHSHFIGSDGEACHPWESCDWKMFDADYFCKDGERKDNENTV